MNIFISPSKSIRWP